MKTLHIESGDHHRGPEYDRFVLVPDDFDAEAALETYNKVYPRRCSEHDDYFSDPVDGCEDCWNVEDLTHDKLMAAGIESDGFPHHAFAEWLVQKQCMGWATDKRETISVY